MKKIIVIIYCTSMMIGTVSAQKILQDVVYLKNDWIIRGKILSQENNTIKIQTSEGNIYVFEAAQVKEIRQEKPFQKNIFYKRKGFTHYTELGALAARNTTANSGVNTSAFSFQTVNGYKFNQWLMTGIGIGIDLYADQNFLPIFGSIRGDIYKEGFLVPYYFLDAGYGINITSNANPNLSFSGGSLVAFGVGLKILFNQNTGFLISAGYRMQNGSSQEELDNGETLRTHLNYERLAIRAGFTF